MSAETTLYGLLSAASSVTSLCGTRIYPDVVPQDKSDPSIAFVRSATEFAMTIHAVLGRTRAQIEVWCHASTRTQADSLAAAVQAALIPNRFFPIDRRAEMDSSSPDSVTFATVLTYSLWE